MTTLAIDVGGSRGRVRLVGEHIDWYAEGPGNQVSDGVIAVRETLAALMDQARTAHPGVRWDAVGVSMASLASLVRDPQGLADDLATTSGCPVGVAVDAYCAHRAALGASEGVSLAVGTGAIALAGAGSDIRRIDGWGYLLGDRGSGAWIGQRGLIAAMAAHDGLESGSRPLMDLAVSTLGEPATWPRQFHGFTDVSRRLAAFAPAVGEAAAAGDPVAARIITDAADHLAHTCCRGIEWAGERVVVMGALIAHLPGLHDQVRTQILARYRNAEITLSDARPLDGAVLVADEALAHGLSIPGYVWFAH